MPTSHHHVSTPLSPCSRRRRCPTPPRQAAPASRETPALATALCVATLATLLANPLSAATLEVRFSGLPSDDGRALFALFAAESGFPNRTETAVARVAGPVLEGRAGVVFENVAPGDYALSALHDVNESGGIDLNLFGVPTEEFGVSNVARGRPTWPEARFHVGEDDVVIELEPLRLF